MAMLLGRGESCWAGTETTATTDREPKKNGERYYSMMQSVGMEKL